MTVATYYDQPALKPAPWGAQVPMYIAIAGIAGSAQIIAGTAAFADGHQYGGVVRAGRYIAVAGAALGAPLLILDLKTPRRWYNMLRIFRPTSPMSIGTYVLTGFGALSAALAAAQWRGDRDGGRGPQAPALQLPAAAAGALMSTYTGALLAATSTPLWAAAPRLLAMLFGASSMASAAAVLSLAAPATPALDRLAAVAGAAELGLLAALRRRLRRAGVEPSGTGLPIVACAAPLLLHAAAEAAWRDRRPRAAAAIAAIAAAFALRQAVMRGGRRSAQRPRDYFRLTGSR